MGRKSKITYPLTMQVDTGWDVFGTMLASIDTSGCSDGHMNKTDIVLKSYTGQGIPVKGNVSVDVVCGCSH